MNAAFTRLAVVVVLLSAMSQQLAAAADSSPWVDEIRLGGSSTLDDGIHSKSVRIETLFAPPPLMAPYDPNLSWLLTPRPLLGAAFSLQGRTNQLFAGLAWTAPLPAGFFLEATLGAMVHDQKLFEPYSDRPELTTRFLFRESISIGVELTEHWRLMAFADHASNGNLGYRNYGVNQVGVMLGHKFGSSPKEIPVAPPITTFSWAGPYLGLNVGLALGSYTFVINEPGAPGDPTNQGHHSVNLGGQVGYNWTFGPLVAGVEGSLTRQGLAGGASRSASQPIDEQISAATPWLATAQARLGLDMTLLTRRFLIYGTGGVANARIAKSYCQRPANPCFINGEVAGGWMTEGGTHRGWTVGAGVEGVLAPRITTKVEYIYANFGSLSYYNGLIRNDLESSQQILRAGFNFRLAGD